MCSEGMGRGGGGRAEGKELEGEEGKEGDIINQLSKDRAHNTESTILVKPIG